MQNPLPSLAESILLTPRWKDGAVMKALRALCPPEARRGQELVSQVTIKHMSYAHFAIAPNARPDASASANSAMFLVIKVPTRTAYRRTPNKFLENPASSPAIAR